MIEVTLIPGEIAPDYRSRIKTPYPFLNHMIEHIVWRGGFNLEVEVTLTNFMLSHVVCEDVGLTIGKVIAEYIKGQKSAYGFGDAFGIIDEARAFSAFSFESRTLLCFDKKVEIPAQTEGMNSEDLTTFIEGIANGANCTLHIELSRGENGHHIWEAIFRSLGSALAKAATINPLRKNYTAGVAGQINFEVTSDSTTA